MDRRVVEARNHLERSKLNPRAFLHELVGAWGCWEFVRGLIMLVIPKWETGDIADQDNDL